MDFVVVPSPLRRVLGDPPKREEYVDHGFHRGNREDLPGVVVSVSEGQSTGVSGSGTGDDCSGKIVERVGRHAFSRDPPFLNEFFADKWNGASGVE
jgi:hypothetical protein